MQTASLCEGSVQAVQNVQAAPGSVLSLLPLLF